MLSSASWASTSTPSAGGEAARTIRGQSLRRLLQGPVESTESHIVGRQEPSFGQEEPDSIRHRVWRPPPALAPL